MLTIGSVALGAILVFLSIRFGKKDFLLVCLGSWIGGIIGYSLSGQEIFSSVPRGIVFLLFLIGSSAICYLIGSVLYFGIIGIYEYIKDT